MEGSFVRCWFPVYRLELASQACVAKVEGEELLVGDFGGLLIEAGFLEAVGPVEEPAVLRHGRDEQSFGSVGRFVIGGQLAYEVVVDGLVFAGEDSEGVWVVVQAVNGAVLTDDGLSDFRRWTRRVSGVLAIGGDLRF